MSWISSLCVFPFFKNACFFRFSWKNRSFTCVESTLLFYLILRFILLPFEKRKCFWIFTCDSEIFEFRDKSTKTDWKIWKNTHFWRNELKNVTKSTTWGDFFMETWNPAIFVDLFFVIFRLWFCVSSLLQCSLMLSRWGFFRSAISCFFAIFAGFDRFRFLHHEQLRYRA